MPVSAAAFILTLMLPGLAGRRMTSAFRNQTIRIGYFMQTVMPPFRIAAISLAIEQAQSEGRLNGYNFR
jgi:hypothetical protein